MCRFGPHFDLTIPKACTLNHAVSIRRLFAYNAQAFDSEKLWDGFRTFRAIARYMGHLWFCQCLGGGYLFPPPSKFFRCTFCYFLLSNTVLFLMFTMLI